MEDISLWQACETSYVFADAEPVYDFFSELLLVCSRCNVDESKGFLCSIVVMIREITGIFVEVEVNDFKVAWRSYNKHFFRMWQKSNTKSKTASPRNRASRREFRIRETFYLRLSI